MSTSEFEREQSEALSDLSMSISGHAGFPEDFSEAEVDFARELNMFFALETEEVPPLLVQTLLAAEDEHLQPLEAGFEKKTHARVFRRLQLERRLFRPVRPSLKAMLGLQSFPRPFMAIGVVCLLFMVLTAAFTGPAFAAGLSYLWSGAHSGVLLVHRYPHVSTSSATPHAHEATQPKQMNMMQAKHLLSFPFYWPQAIPERYTQSDAYLYKGDSSWADGPILVLNFSNAQPGIAPRQISICEFKPLGKVLQVVQDGAAQEVTIGRDGFDSAIYVQGQWTPANSSSPAWVYTDRSQLISEKDGVVFWIVGDKRDGIDRNQLSAIASSLTVFDGSQNTHTGNAHLDRIFQSDDYTPWFLADDVIYLDSPDKAGGPTFKVVKAEHASAPPVHNHVRGGFDDV